MPKATKPIRAKRAKPRRTTVFRCRPYLDWLKERECLVSGEGEYHSYPIDPAHGPSAGKGLKGTDSGAVPLCRFHHEQQHSIGWPDFEKRYGFSREKEAAAHFALFELLRGA
jgi:hypothetical protein